MNSTFCSFMGVDGTDRVLPSVRGLHRELHAYLATHVARRGSRPPGTTPRELPDLLEVLGARGLAGGPAADAAAFRSSLEDAGRPLVVGRCRVDDDGTYAVSVYAYPRQGPEVRLGDVFFGGVQFSGNLGKGTVRVEPHLLRLACANGATYGVESYGLEYARRGADAKPVGDLSLVVMASMSGYALPKAEAALRRAAGVRGVVAARIAAARGVALSAEVVTRIVVAQTFEEPTLYGHYNAMTRVARDHASLAMALRIEQAAGRLVERPSGAPSLGAQARRPVPV